MVERFIVTSYCGGVVWLMVILLMSLLIGLFAFGGPILGLYVVFVLHPLTIPFLGVLTGAVRIAAESIIKIKGIRQYFLAATLAEVVAIALIPLCTVFHGMMFATDKSKETWLNRQEEIAGIYRNSHDELFGHCAFGPRITSGLSPTDQKYANLVIQLEDICFWQGCIQNSTPFTMGFPIVAIFALLTFNQHNRRQGKT